MLDFKFFQLRGNSRTTQILYHKRGQRSAHQVLLQNIDSPHRDEVNQPQTHFCSAHSLQVDPHSHADAFIYS